MRKIILLVLSFVVTACGGGGGGGENPVPTDTSQSFSLSRLQSTNLGTIYTTQLTGSDSEGATYTGTASIANRAQAMFGGVLVTPQDLILSLSDGGSSITITSTSYIDSSRNLIALYVQTTGLTCSPVSPDNIPTSVKIGDFGILSTLVCSDNTTMERNWRVEDAGNGKIRVVSNGVVKNQFNVITSVTDVTYTIDSNGNIVTFKTVSEQSESGYILTYQSI